MSKRFIKLFRCVCPGLLLLCAVGVEPAAVAATTKRPINQFDVAFGIGGAPFKRAVPTSEGGCVRLTVLGIQSPPRLAPAARFFVVWASTRWMSSSHWKIEN